LEQLASAASGRIRVEKPQAEFRQSGARINFSGYTSDVPQEFFIRLFSRGHALHHWADPVNFCTPTYRLCEKHAAAAGDLWLPPVCIGNAGLRRALAGRTIQFTQNQRLEARSRFNAIKAVAHDMVLSMSAAASYNSLGAFLQYQSVGIRCGKTDQQVVDNYSLATNRAPIH